MLNTLLRKLTIYSFILSVSTFQAQIHVQLYATDMCFERR